MGDTNRQVADLLEQALSVFDGVVFGALRVADIFAWVRQRDAAAAWFAALEYVVLSGLFRPDGDTTSLLARVTLPVLAPVAFSLLHGGHLALHVA